jgi:hypothetical protein
MLQTNTSEVCSTECSPPTEPTEATGEQRPEALLLAHLDSERRVTPSHVNRASEVGHPCERYLVYRRTAWQEAQPPDIHLQGIFDFGRDYEELLRRKLMAAGYQFRQPHRPEFWEHFQLSGTNDGEISWDLGKTWHMIEIKGLHPNFWTKVNAWRDFLTMGPIYAKYPAQVQVYMMLDNIDSLFFVLGRKGSYDVKFLPVELDYEYAEGILAKVERVNAHVAAGTLPAKLEDLDACDICSFREHCLPDTYYGAGAWITHQAELIGMLDERRKLAPQKSGIEAAYNKLQERIKQMIGGAPVVMAGDYQITQRSVTKRPSPGSTYSMMRVKCLKESQVEDEEAE